MCIKPGMSPKKQDGWEDYTKIALLDITSMMEVLSSDPIFAGHQTEVHQ